MHVHHNALVQPQLVYAKRLYPWGVGLYSTVLAKATGGVT